MSRLADAGRTVLLETSGALDIGPVDASGPHHPRPEDPWLGEVEANLWSNLSLLKATDEVKFVICDRLDFDWAVEQVRAYALTDRCPVLFRARLSAKLHPTDLATWVLESSLAVRLQVQLHKVLWDPAAHRRLKRVATRTAPDQTLDSKQSRPTPARRKSIWVKLPANRWRSSRRCQSDTPLRNVGVEPRAGSVPRRVRTQTMHSVLLRPTYPWPPDESKFTKQSFFVWH